MRQSTSLWWLVHFQNLRTKNKILNSSEIENFLRFAISDFCGHQTFLHGQLGPPVDVFLPPQSFDTVCEALFSSFALWAPLRGKFKVMTSSVVFQSFLENQIAFVFNLSCCGFHVFSLNFKAHFYVLILSRALSNSFR